MKVQVNIEGVCLDAEKYFN